MRFCSIVLLLLLAGCSSKTELEMCMQATIQANEPYSNQQIKDEVEARARADCLKVTSVIQDK